MGDKCDNEIFSSAHLQFGQWMNSEGSAGEQRGSWKSQKGTGIPSSPHQNCSRGNVGVQPGQQTPLQLRFASSWSQASGTGQEFECEQPESKITSSLWAEPHLLQSPKAKLWQNNARSPRKTLEKGCDHIISLTSFVSGGHRSWTQRIMAHSWPLGGE